MSPPFETASGNSDPFFILRDVRALIEKRLAEIAMQVGSIPVPAASTLAKAAGDAHDELASDKMRDGFESAANLTASRMTLMCDADLEINIAIGNLVRRVLEHCNAPLWRTYQRYVTLLSRPHMKPEDNPVGPEALTAGLWALSNACDVSHDRKLAMLGELEAVYASELPAFYDSVNDLLAHRGIDPALPKVVQTSGAMRNSASPEAYKNSAGDAFGALQRILSRNTVATGENVTLNAATLVMLNQLAAKLDRLALPASDGNITESMPPRALKAADLGLPLGNPEGVAMETLGHIFEAIFDIWDLPDTVKTAISRLQIPLLRLSICDSGLFFDDKHPARRLINLMGQSVTGLPRDIPRSHPISVQLWDIASKVAEVLQGDASVLDAPLREVESIIREREQGLQSYAEPLIAHLDAECAALRKIERAGHWLMEITAVPSVKEFHEFIRDHWLHVMVASAEESDAAWHAASETIDDLLWSVQPKTDASERKRLALLVPSLIRRINNGLDLIGMSQEQRVPFLDLCFNLQTSSLRGASPVLLPGSTTDAKRTVTLCIPKPEASQVIAGIELRRELHHGDDGEANVSPVYNNMTAAAYSGCWLQITCSDNTNLIGFVVWVDSRQGLVLIVNPDWGFALVTDTSSIDHWRKNGNLVNLSRRAIFDQAADHALQRIAGNAVDVS